MRLHRILPLAAAVLLAACQAGDPTAPSLAPAGARMGSGQTGGSGGSTATAGTSTTSGTTETTTSTDSTSVTGRGSQMGGSGG